MSSRWGNRLWFAIVPLLLLVNCLLILQNLTLRNRLAGSEPSRDYLRPRQGELLPAVTAFGLYETKEHRFDFEGGGESLLLYFSPRCPVCTRQFVIWKRLYETMPISIKVYLFVSDIFPRDEIKQYLERMGVASREVFILPKESRVGLKLGATPITVAVKSTGEAERVWVGGWLPETVQEVADYFFGERHAAIRVQIVALQANGTFPH